MQVLRDCGAHIGWWLHLPVGPGNGKKSTIYGNDFEGITESDVAVGQDL